MSIFYALEVVLGHCNQTQLQMFENLKAIKG